MSIKTATTSISSASSAKSGQSKSYQYPSGNGVVITGSAVNSQTTAYIDVATPGAARSFTAVSGGAVISNIQYLDANNVVANAIAASTSGGNILINGTGFASNSRVYVNNQLVTNTYVNSNAIIATLSANSVGNVSLAVFNSSGQNGVFSNSNVRFSGAPSWVSAAAVSSYNGVASNISLQASGDGTLTYSLKSGSGSLPTGISLVSSGYLSGTATGYTADTVVTFTLIVADTESQEAQQTFSYTVFIGDTYFKQTSLLLSATVSNTFISDSSTNNFLITRNGDTRPSRFSPYWPGGWSGYFDGTGDYLSFPNSSGLALGSNNFTVECWFYKTASTGNDEAIFFMNGTNAAWASMRLGIEAPSALSNALSLLMTNNTSSWTVSAQSAANVFLTNVWNHVAVVRNGTSVRVYLNGNFVINTTFTGSTLTSGTLNYLGDLEWTGGRRPFLGYLSNFRVVNGTALYTANFTPSTTSLTTVANTSLLTLRDSKLADYSPYNLAITRNGDTKLTTFSPFNTAPHTITANSNSVYFDGTGDVIVAADSVNFDFGTNDFTIETWIYPITISSDHYIFSMNTSTGSAGHCSINVYQSNWRVGLFNNYMPVNGTVSASSALNKWNHIALVRYNNNLSFYVNGSSIGTAANVQNVSIDSAGTFAIGRYSVTDTNYYNGYISNFRAVKGTAVYTANFTPATSALTAISGTSLLACQANTIIDSNTTPKTLTVNGNPNVSLANPFGETVTTISNYTWTANSYGASAYFDGTGDYLTANAASDWTFLHNGASDYTVEGYFFTTSTAVQQTLISTAAGSADIGILIDINNTATGDIDVQMYRGSVGSYLQWKSAGSLFNLNSWNHFAFTFKTSTKTGTVFLNGRSVATSDQAAWPYSSSNPTFTLALGRYQNATPGGYLIGYLSDLRITKSILYANTYIPPAAPVSNVANVSLLTLQSDIGSNSAQFLDQSPNNHLITRNGNASQGTYGPLVPSTWSAYFDGTGDFLSLTTNEAFDYGTGNFTIECWFYIAGNSATNNSNQKAAALFATYPASSTINGYALELSGNASTTGTGLSFASWVSGSSAVVQNNSLTITQNAWHHVAVVRNGTSTTIYYDGGNVASGALSNQNVNTSGNTLKIGTMGYAGYIQDFVGYISNARIIKGIAQYTANFIPSTTTIGPVANTSVLTLRGPAFTDDSGNNFTITRNGDTKIVPFGPFSPQIVTPDSYSYKFSNASDYISTVNSNLALGQNNWTVESWVYPRFTANSGIFQISNVQYGLTNSNLNTVALGFSSSNKAIVRVANATYTSTGTTITANAWTHLALVKSSNVSKLYINGTLDSTIGTSGSITDTVNYAGTTNIAIGGYGSTSALANAYISNFRVVSNSAVYTENFTPAVGPLTSVSGTTLLTCQANTVIDSSTANLTMTANANVTPSIFNPFDETVSVGQTYTALTSGGGAYFDGNGDYLRLTAGVLGSGNFSIEFWFYALELRSNAAYFDQTSGLLFRQDTANILVYDRTTNLTILTTSGNLCKAYNWDHIAIIRSNGVITVYINGKNAGSVSNTTNFNATDTYIGAFINNQTTGCVNGYFSNFRIINGTALYTSNFVPPAGPALPTTANTSLLLNFTNSGVIDSTGRNVLETVADAKVTTNLKKYGTGSYYFDGTGDYMYVMGNSTELAFGTGDFTVECWAYFNSLGGAAAYAPIFVNGYLFYVGYQGEMLLFDGTNNVASGPTGAVTINNWYHLAWTRASNTVKLFVNGTQTGNNATVSGSITTGSPNAIGQYSSIRLNGYIADLRVTKGYARYTANFTVPSEPFILK